MLSCSRCCWFVAGAVIIDGVGQPTYVAGVGQPTYVAVGQYAVPLVNILKTARMIKL